MTRLEVFISQLDGLVIFLAASRREVFDTIKNHESTWFPESQDPRLPDTFESYRVTVANAAFLLGYAYFETFLADLARDIYTSRPILLPSDKKIGFKEVIAADSKADIIRAMIEIEIRSVFYGAIETVRDYFEKRFQVSWPDQAEIVLASRIRNCLMHNGGIVDERLAEIYNRGTEMRICLDAGEVHRFGIVARSFARTIWDDANRRHLQGTG